MKSLTKNEQLDDLIMRLKDCISHGDNPHQKWGDRCITKVQFKQQMKTYITATNKALLDKVREGLPGKKDSSINSMDWMNYRDEGFNQCLSEVLALLNQLGEEK